MVHSRVAHVTYAVPTALKRGDREFTPSPGLKTGVMMLGVPLALNMLTGLHDCSIRIKIQEYVIVRACRHWVLSKKRCSKLPIDFNQ